ncbi:hypothetical protein, partial [Streptomyces sp. NPDC059271]|uniref:hypothetical protein n=1 Tax=Streptomyces sp. NPDC059271 TaxID=3346799 RepID=UPI00367833CA
PLNQTSVINARLLDPNVSDGHLMYRHGPSRRTPTAGSDWPGADPGRPDLGRGKFSPSGV